MKRRRKATVINKQIIKDFMKENHLTQKQFAEKCNLSVRLIQTLLNGECPNLRFDTLMKLLSTLQVNCSELFN